MKFKVWIDDLTVEKGLYLEDIYGVSNYFLTREVALDPFEYHDPQVEKVKQLVWGATERG